VAQKLPLTVLEIHVLAHDLCAFAMYAACYEKPYDVESPILLEGEIESDLAALCCLDDGDNQVSTNRPATAWKCARNPIPRSLTLSEVAPSHELQPYLSFITKYMARVLRNMKEVCLAPSKEARPAPNETPELLQHLDRANRGLEYLRECGVHFTYASKSTVYESTHPNVDGEVEIQPGTSISIPHPYTVSSRSNLIVEAISNISPDSEKRDKFSNIQIIVCILPLISLEGGF
jgi:hypothetical protein